MEDTYLSPKKIKQILEIARLAPSVHNTQPWLVEVNENKLSIKPDEEHTLKQGDPTGRQTTISLGIFSEAAIIGAESIGLQIDNLQYSKRQINLSLIPSNKVSSSAKELAANLCTRVSDRSFFQKTELNNTKIQTIKQAWSSDAIKIWVMNDPEFIKKLAGYTASGIRLALSNPEFRSELSKYLVRPWSSKLRGIAVKSLCIPYFLAIAQPEILRLGLFGDKEAVLEKKRWLSASTVVLITSKGDLHKDWFEAGRAYLRASLAVEHLGLSQATSAATVEAATFHEDVEKLLGTKQRLQAVIRVGTGSTKKHFSPRVSVKEFTTLS
ncbi:hypothetical protein KY385_04425 [Candidatus Parcubacteria bacterium]|nr:hypothetical protein [Candidatus Parcubacteria bacterium]